MTTDIDLSQLGFGWLGHRPDIRDYKLAALRPDLLALVGTAPTEFHGMAQYRTRHRSQGNTNSCVSWGCTGAKRVRLRVLGLPDFDPSELFTYYNARVKSGLQNQDQGAYIRDGMKAMADDGNCEEQACLWDPARINQKPPQAAYQNGAAHQLERYLAVPNGREIWKTLISQNYPIVFGVPVYENVGQAFTTGEWPMPAGKLIGYHCMFTCEYDAVGPYADNSWSGLDLARMRWEYVEALAADNWYPDLIEGEPQPEPEPEPEPKPEPRPPYFSSFYREDYLSNGEKWITTGKYDPPPGV